MSVFASIQAGAKACERQLSERVCSRLGLLGPPSVDLEGLSALYSAWCERVPFDSIGKRIHLASGASGPLPGSTAESFFERWLEYGSGGTCWAGSGALASLLVGLGFEVELAMATMMPNPDVRGPNHGTVAVKLGESSFLVDTSILHGRPLCLVGDGHTKGSGGATLVRSQGKAEFSWWPLHAAAPFPCRLDTIGVEAIAFDRQHQSTRAWSPFNFVNMVRVNRGEVAIGLAMGKRVELDAQGKLHSSELSPVQRREFLIEEIGLADCIVDSMPADRPLSAPQPPDRVR